MLPVSIIADLASTILVGFLVWQTFMLRQQVKDAKSQIKILQDQFNLTREDFENKSRPWIGHSGAIEDKGFVENTNRRRYHLELTNYGEFPAQRAKVRIKSAKQKMGREEAAKSELTTYLGTIFPKMKRGTLWDLTADEFPSDKDCMLYLSVVIEYEYGTKNMQAITGIIYEYDSERQEFVIDDAWAT